MEVSFVATIVLDEGWEEEAEGNVAQAVQNAIGHTGAVVVEADPIDDGREQPEGFPNPGAGFCGGLAR